MQEPRLKTLTMDEAWGLYRILKHAIGPETDDELSYIMDHAHEGTMLESIRLMYEGLPDMVNPFETILLFVRGINNTRMLDFLHFIKGITYGSSK